jgi:hypothetical protein
MGSFFEVARGVAEVVVGLGLVIAVRQLTVTKRQSQSRFEAVIVDQYRSIVAQLPANALLGLPLDEQELTSHLRTFYRYFEFANQQAFLASQGVLNQQTWHKWQEGMEQHFRRPAFQQAWVRLAPQIDGNFEDLKNLVCPELVMVFANYQQVAPAYSLASVGSEST